MILAANVERSEDELVLPFLKGNGYGFIPLKTELKWAEQAYKLVGTPLNLLIDSEGRIMFKPGVVDAQGLPTLEREIDQLLRARKKAGTQ